MAVSIFCSKRRWPGQVSRKLRDVNEKAKIPRSKHDRIGMDSNGFVFVPMLRRLFYHDRTLTFMNLPFCFFLIDSNPSFPIPLISSLSTLRWNNTTQNKTTNRELEEVEASEVAVRRLLRPVVRLPRPVARHPRPLPRLPRPHPLLLPSKNLVAAACSPESDRPLPREWPLEPVRPLPTKPSARPSVPWAEVPRRATSNRPPPRSSRNNRALMPVPSREAPAETTSSSSSTALRWTTVTPSPAPSFTNNCRPASNNRPNRPFIRY